MVLLRCLHLVHGKRIVGSEFVDVSLKGVNVRWVECVFLMLMSLFVRLMKFRLCFKVRKLMNAEDFAHIEPLHPSYLSLKLFNNFCNLFLEELLLLIILAMQILSIVRIIEIPLVHWEELILFGFFRDFIAYLRFLWFLYFLLSFAFLVPVDRVLTLYVLQVLIIISLIRKAWWFIFGWRVLLFFRWTFIWEYLK